MTCKLLTGAALAVAALALSACGHGGVSTPPPPAKGPADHFGAGFAADFKADPNSTPPRPTPSDIVAADPAAQPVALH